MALRDTDWIWDTTTATPKTSNAIITNKTGGLESTSAGSRTAYRTKSTTTYEWIGMTKSAVLSFDSKMVADTSNDDSSWTVAEKNRITSEYGVTMVVTSITGWSINP